MAVNLLTGTLQSINQKPNWKLVYLYFQSLSREHACIEVKGDSVFIYDKGSRNKTKRNRVRKWDITIPWTSIKSIYEF